MDDSKKELLKNMIDAQIAGKANPQLAHQYIISKTREVLAQLLKQK